MTEENSAYANWLKNLTKICLPIDLQRKIVALEPLSREEAEKFANVLLIAGQARQLQQGDKMKLTVDDIEKKVDRVLKMSRQQLKNERAILWYTSSGDSRYKPADGRHSSPVRRVMVQYAQTLIEKDSSLSERSAALIVIKKFADIEGAYKVEDLESFRRQINRQNPLS